MRTANDGTIVIYDKGCVTTHHKKYMCKIRKLAEEFEDSGNAGTEIMAGAESRANSQQ